MIASEGSGKWVFSIFFAIFLVVTLSYPHKVFLFLKIFWGLIVLNVRPFIQEILQNVAKHWPF